MEQQRTLSGSSQSPRSPTSQPFLSVSVTDPVKLGNGVQAYISYRVITNTNFPEYQGPEKIVIRRYSDFVWLRDRIFEKYKGVFIPPLPEKSAVEKFRFSAEFIEMRRQALDIFVNRIASHHELQQSEDLRNFLQADEETMERLRAQETGIFKKKPADLMQMFKFGPFIWKTYKEVYDEVLRIGSALRASGAEPGSRVGIYGSNCPQWIMAMEACNAHSLVCVPLYDTLGPGAVNFILDHAEVDFVFVQDKKVKEILNPDCRSAQRLKIMVCFTSLTEEEKIKAAGIGIKPYSWNEFLHMGKENPTEIFPPQALNICTIMYTSGTSGDPKGVVLTHENIAFFIRGIDLFLDQLEDKMTENDVYLSFLPLAHILDRVIEEYFFRKGASVGYYHGDLNALVEDLMELKPTLFAGIKARLGGRVRLILSGGAPLSSEVEEFLRVTCCAFVVTGYESEEATRTFETIVRLMNEELVRFQDQKTLDMGIAFNEFAKGQARLANSIADAWRSLLPKLEACPVKRVATGKSSTKQSNQTQKNFSNPGGRLGDPRRQAWPWVTSRPAGIGHGKPPRQAWPWVTSRPAGIGHGKPPQQAWPWVTSRPAGISTASHRGRLGWSLLRGVASGVGSPSSRGRGVAVLWAVVRCREQREKREQREEERENFSEK
uniref:PX domain-containing protein n=1 Tax=Fagus sylvatica TaxID=28930 RepID=A0A2N9EK27_FAGSY